MSAILSSLILRIFLALGAIVTLPISRAPTDAHDLIVWRLNETTASWVNSGSAGTLTLVVRSDATVAPVANNGVSPSQVAIPGFPGGANQRNYISTSGTGAGTSVGELGSTGTISFYVYLNDYNAANGGNYTTMFVKNGATTGTSLGWQVNLNNTVDGAWYCGIDLSGTDQFFGYLSGVHIPLNAWTHIGCTYDGANIRTYQNGALTSTTACSPCGAVGYGSHGSYEVGGGQNGGFNNVHGSISDLRVADVARPLAFFQAMAR